MKPTLLLILALLCLISCKQNPSPEAQATPTEQELNPDHYTPAERIAMAYGIDNWEQVNELAFTFNVAWDGGAFDRSFVWYPKDDRVVFTSATDTVDYIRSQVDSLSLGADQRFINDKYWLLVPFQLVWDQGVTFEEVVQEAAPISGTMMNKLTYSYGDEGGYTPGDAYDLYYTDDYTVHEWVYRKGGQPEASRTYTWEDHKEIGGIRFAAMHKDTTPAFKLFFTDVKVN